MMGFVSSGASGSAGAGAPAVFSLRQFGSGEINDVVLWHARRLIGTQAGEPSRQHDDSKQHESFDDPGEQHPAIGEKIGPGLTGQALGRLAQSRPDSRGEL